MPQFRESPIHWRFPSQVSKKGMEAVEKAKTAGNDAFLRKRFDAAELAYRDGLEKLAALCEDAAHEDEDSSKRRRMRVVLLCNRANALSALGRFEEAVVDANSAIALDPSWAKAYYWKGQSLEKLGRSKNAKMTYLAAIRAGCDENMFRELVRKLKSQVKFPSLYPDRKPPATSASEVKRRRAEENLAKIKEYLGSQGGAGALMNGLFEKLLKPEEFRKIMYRSNALPKDVENCMPKSLQDLLGNQTYFDSLVALFPKIQEKAESVFKNAKLKGERDGLIMDEATEKMLKPQILNEAFAHQVVDMIHEIGRSQKALIAEATELEASPEAKEAFFDQVPQEAIEALSDDQISVASVPSFFYKDEADWLDLLIDDMKDLALGGLLEPRDVTHTTRRDLVKPQSRKHHDQIGYWSCQLSFEQVESQFPALKELASRLLALPFELNRKIPGLRLRMAVDTRFVVSCIGDPHKIGNDEGHEFGFEELPWRFEGDFGDQNNGNKVTISYMFTEATRSEVSAQGPMRLFKPRRSATEAQINRVPWLSDHLVLYRSRTLATCVGKISGPAKRHRFSVCISLQGSENREQQW